MRLTTERGFYICIHCMYADFHVLTRVKRKRKKEDRQVSSGVGRYGTTPVNTNRSLGSFIQSALSKAKEQEEEEEEGEGKQAATGGRGEGGSKKGSSRARKKLKLGWLCMKYELLCPLLIILYCECAY